jgi:flagellar protein FliJ
MNAMEQLVRLHRWSVDEKRRQIGDLQRLRLKLSEDVSRLDSDLATEMETARDGIEFRRAFTAYEQVVRSRRSRLTMSIADVDKEVLRAQDELAATYRELKRYEQALASRTARDKAVRQRKEQLAEDEIALSIHRRKS